MAAEIGPRHLCPPQISAERRRDRAVLGEKRQQHQPRQSGIVGEMREPGADDRLGRIALDQRRAERTVRMRPADEDRQLEPIAALRDARRKKAEQLSRPRSRPDQDRADAVAEHGRGGERESGLVKDVGLERARGEVAPVVRYRDELGQPAPFHRKGVDRVTVGDHGAARAGDGRNGALKRDTRRVVRTGPCHNNPCAE